MSNETSGRQSRPVEATVSPVTERACTLEHCPPGLFMGPGGNLGLKTEYCDENGPEAYVVASGEVWWGGAKTHEERLAQEVWPCEVMANAELTRGEAVALNAGLEP